MPDTCPHWRKASASYHEKADEYDRWFTDNSRLFSMELEAIRALNVNQDGPILEIGVGPGHFAVELSIDYGLDPAAAPLLKSASRGIKVCRGIGEQLPFGNASFASVYILFSECFFKDPKKVFAECHRILVDSGILVVGFVPATSSWGKALIGKGLQGDIYYRHARLHTVAELEQILEESNFTVTDTVATLFQSPGKPMEKEVMRKTASEEAGFVALACLAKQ